MTRYGPLAAAVALLIGAGWEVQSSGPGLTPFGSALVAAGLIVLGVWLAVESYHLWANHNAREESDES